jgi:hypothetical protein
MYIRLCSKSSRRSANGRVDQRVGRSFGPLADSKPLAQDAFIEHFVDDVTVFIRKCNAALENPRYVKYVSYSNEILKYHVQL